MKSDRILLFAILLVQKAVSSGIQKSAEGRSPELSVWEEIENKNSTGCDTGQGCKSYIQLSTNYSETLQDTIVKPVGTRILINCTAPYLLKWVSEILPQDSAYLETRRYDQNPLGGVNADRAYIYTIGLFFTVADTNSGWIHCRSHQNSSLVAQVFIFSEAKKDSGVPDIVEADSIVQVESLDGTLHVKCIANFPDYIPQLYTLEDYDGDDVPVDPSRLLKPYDPRFGYYIQGSGGDASQEIFKCIGDGTEFYVQFKKENASEKLSIPLLIKTGESGENGEKLLDVFCETDDSRILVIKMLRCRFPDECDLLKVCFEKCWLYHGSTIKHDVEKLEIRETSKTTTIKNPFPIGMVQCYMWVTQKIIYRYYFLGLDRLSYIVNESTIPEGALIRLETQEQNYFTTRAAKFLCEISTFLLVSNIQFFATLKNGSQIPLADVSGDPAFTEFEDRGFSRKTAVVNVTKEMASIHCMAPWYNSSEWMRTQPRSITVREGKTPIIDTSVGKEIQVFYKGEENKLLHCTATGHPNPKISWILPSETLKGKLRYKDIAEKESTINFPVIEQSFKGTYKCVATNDFGRAEFEFRVDVNDLGLSTVAIAGISVAGAGFLSLLLGLLYLAWKYNKAQEQIRDLTEEEIQEFTYGNPEAVSAEETDPETAKSKGFRATFVIPEEDLIVAKETVLGEGEYGMVFRGFLHGEAVAVKTTKANADVSYFKALLGELKIMAYIGQHPQVVRFYGAVINRIRERIVFAVVELSPLGNLQGYLRKMQTGFQSLKLDKEVVVETSNYTNIEKSITTLNLVHWCKQIADGMSYLSSRKVIHGDLAARNILVYKNDTVKITDFGLSRQMYGYSNYVKKQKAPLPWRWMAIESLRFMEFSSETDVWAFGITAWEIFSFAQVPYPGLTWSWDFVDKLLEGLRLAKPGFTPQIVYEYMLRCWDPKPSRRPTFEYLRDKFQDILVQHGFTIENPEGTLSPKSEGAMTTQHKNEYTNIQKSGFNAQNGHV